MFKFLVKYLKQIKKKCYNILQNKLNIYDIIFLIAFYPDNNDLKNKRQLRLNSWWKQISIFGTMLLIYMLYPFAYDLPTLSQNGTRPFEIHHSPSK
jgi:hypothetical protein